MTDRFAFGVPRSTLLLLAGLGCGRAAAVPPKAEPTSQARVVRLAPVTDTSVVQPVTATGILGAKEEVPLGFKIGGVIGRIAVEEGDVVAAGQLLATLELPEIAGEVAKAEAGLRQAERDLARAEALYADSVIPRSVWEGAGTAVEVANANLQIARFNQRYAVIRAPGAGTILRRTAEPGQQIGGGVPVLLLGRSGQGQVLRAGLADRDAARVAPGDPAVVRFDAPPGTVMRGRVSQIAAQATPGTGTWVVEIRLEHPVSGSGRGLQSGLIGAVEIRPRREERVRLIPIAALLEGDGDSAAVYTLADHGTDTVAERRGVRIAFLAGEQAAVRAGLEGVHEVLTEGAAYVRDGDPVRPMRSGSATDGGVP
jgi:membrane fusion protein, multidrug efflux system